MRTLLISDLHLTPSRPAMMQAFVDFLHAEARQAAALYILGDLFEYWIGDDAADSLGYGEIVDELARLTGTGSAVYFMHGNRDFLVGQGFADRTGVTLLPDPSVHELLGRPALLMHGDSLCTDDTEHQAFRRMVADPRWQAEFLALSIEERRRRAESARRASRRSDKPDSIMDVNPEAVVQAMDEHGVELLVHGHTHRPAVHELAGTGSGRCRVVLGDWHEEPSVLEVAHGNAVLLDARVAAGLVPLE